MRFPKIASLRTHESLRTRIEDLGIDLPSDEQVFSGEGAPLGQSFMVGERRVGNRFCILPMEGWDGTADGKPSELTRRRWRRFGESGAKLIWGGEAFAVRHEGRANPNQLLINENTAGSIAQLRSDLVEAHTERFGASDDLLVGIQLTHSGRFARPNDHTRLEPRIAYRHPILDPKFGIDNDAPLLSDEDLDRLVDDFVAASKIAQQLGFAFVDIKHCHGYLGHELLSGINRPGRYGGDFVGRTRFLRNVVAGIGSEAPSLEVGVRLSVFDFCPFQSGDNGAGVPAVSAPYPFAFGGDGAGLGIDLDEPERFLALLDELGVRMVCTTAGSPYYNPHIQRPAAFPPCDGYLPPEDPLVGVARQINAVAELKRRRPDALLIGAGYSYLQDWLPNVAQSVVRNGLADAIGIGRMVLSYPELPRDVLAGEPLQRKLICRTFSDCTTAPRNGMVSGCFPLDEFYKERPERSRLAQIAKASKT